MRRILALSSAVAAAVSVSACQTPQQQNALFGGALGAGTGAIMGSAVSGSAGGALAGAAIGAGTGALLGAAATPPPAYYGGLALPPTYAPPQAYYGLPPGPPPGPGRCAQWVFDYNGNRVCTAFY
jgi:hypothetical protein